MEKNNSNLLKARAYAFLLLKYRQRSEKEISDRLKRKNYSPETVKETLDFLREKKFVDDQAFALAWLRERLARSIGLRRLKQELKIKGISPEVIDRALAQNEGAYNEAETVRELAENRLNRLKDLDTRIAKRRVYAYLLRRGFSPDTVIDTLDQFD